MREDSKDKSEADLTADHFIEIWFIENVRPCESVKAAALNEIRRLVKIADVTFFNWDDRVSWDSCNEVLEWGSADS